MQKLTRSEAKFSNTSKKMNQALLELLEYKNCSEISISEICKKAGINRSTFYSHYSNIYDLYSETYENLIAQFFNSFSQEDYKNADISVETFLSEKYIIPYLEFVSQHRKFYKSYISSFEKFNKDTYSFLIQNFFVPLFKKRGVEDLTMIEYISKFYLSGINRIVLNWISKDCKEEISYIYKIISFCIRGKINGQIV